MGLFLSRKSQAGVGNQRGAAFCSAWVNLFQRHEQTAVYISVLIPYIWGVLIHGKTK